MRYQLTDKEKSRRIMKMIRYAERRLRERYRVLASQDLLASSILFVSLVAMVVGGYLYATGAIAWWACVLWNAFWASLLHELEHDQIHRLYYQKRHRWMERLLFAIVWLARGNTPHPLYRRALHFQHHRQSGTRADVEERFITNGLAWGPQRLLALFDQRVAFFVQGRRLLPFLPRSEVGPLRALGVLLLFYVVWDLFCMYQLARFGTHVIGAATGGPNPTLPVWMGVVGEYLTLATVVWVAPNLLRQFCLQFVSSSMHYYGDFEGDLFRQTQVLNAWFLIPANLFCFNFGSTHSIHHFVVNQPFYLRQLVAPWAHAGMRRYGVRFNDLGSFRRANRFYGEPTYDPA